MKIPKKIKIGNLIYQIKSLVDSEETHYGKSSEKDQWIRLSRNLVSEDKKWETLWHEIIHQILDHGSYYEESKNEKLIDLLVNGIYRVLKENKLSR